MQLSSDPGDYMLYGTQFLYLSSQTKRLPPLLDLLIFFSVFFLLELPGINESAATSEAMVAWQSPPPLLWCLVFHACCTAGEGCGIVLFEGGSFSRVIIAARSFDVPTRSFLARRPLPPRFFARLPGLPYCRTSAVTSEGAGLYLY